MLQKIAWFSVLLLALALAGCAGVKATSLSFGETYLVSTWTPCDSDEVQRRTIKSICAKFDIPLLKQYGPYFWTRLQPSQIDELERDRRVGGVGDYGIVIKRELEKDAETVVPQICEDYVLEFDGEILFDFLFYTQMSEEKKKLVEADPRVRWTEYNLVGCGTRKIGLESSESTQNPQ